MRRETYTPQPVDGDYILRCTGISWSILRSTGHDSAMSISTQDRNRKAALARIRSLTETDHADGWEADGDGLFRQITRFRRHA
jgi:hypothetical protein